MVFSIWKRFFAGAPKVGRHSRTGIHPTVASTTCRFIFTWFTFSRHSHSYIFDWNKLTVCWAFSFAAMCWNLGTRRLLHGGGHDISICTCFLWWSWKPSEGTSFLKNHLCMVFGPLMRWCVINLCFLAGSSSIF